MLITELNGVVCSLKGNGPKIEPWGTPHETLNGEENPIYIRFKSAYI